MSIPCGTAPTSLTFSAAPSSMGPGGGIYTPPVVSGTSFSTEPKPDVLLTVQSALAGTLEANGQSIPKPGESVIIKLDNNGTAVPPSSFYQTPNIGSSDFGGAGFLSQAGITASIRRPTPTLTQGAGSQIRFLGIGGNQTTGQPRVPVIITSYLDDTVGSDGPRCDHGPSRAQRHASTCRRGRRTDPLRRQRTAELQHPRPPRRQPDRQHRHPIYHRESRCKAAGL